MTRAKLEIENLEKHFSTNQGFLSRIWGSGDKDTVHAVDGVSLSINEGESLGLAGESGCGKTTLAKTTIRLIEPTGGHIYLDGDEVTNIEGKALKKFRRNAQIIHQDPYESLNPRITVFNWVAEPLKIHNVGKRREYRERVIQILEEVGLRPPETYLDQRPPDLSGGERQRVGIARALILEPSLLVADEPASMLDVSIRADVLNLLQDLQQQYNMTALYISHDLSLLKHMCDRIAIMYLGKVVETGTPEEIINDPHHPYTKALVSAIPRINPESTWNEVELSSEVPDPINVPDRCRFYERCPEAKDECKRNEPPLYPIGDGRDARCILYKDD